jgi:hypothetical protein
MMATDHILALLVIERDKIISAIEALQGPTKRKGRSPGSGRKPVEQDSPPLEMVASIAPAKRKLSAAGRQAIIAATKKRWAAVRAARVAAAPAPAPVAAKQKASPAKRAAFRKKMSETMKKAWAARKKKAAAKAE